MNKDEMLEVIAREISKAIARKILLQVEHDYVEYPALTIFEILDRIADRYGIDWDEIHEHNI